MSQDDRQLPIKRRSITTGGQESRQLRYPKAVEKINSSPRTDDPFGDEDALLDSPRTNTSVIRYDASPGVQTQRVGGVASTTAGVSQRRQTGTKISSRPRATTLQGRPQNRVRRGVHWLLPLGVGMVAMLVLWLVGSTVVAWGVQRYNDVRYGNPRTFQTDKAVGHNDSNEHPSHFIAINLNRQAIVVELMGGDPAKSVSYVAPVYIDGPGGDLAPITLDFKDLNGDGKLDMIIQVHLSSGDQISVFINDGTKFRPSTNTDKLHT